MSAPAIILIIIQAMSLGMSWDRHGEKKEKTENAWASLATAILMNALLWWGGFYG